jgi:hypothetical protein
MDVNSWGPAISVQPDGDSWKVTVMQEGSPDDVDRHEMVEQIAARLKAEYDLIEGLTQLFQPMNKRCKNVASAVNEHRFRLKSRFY